MHLVCGDTHPWLLAHLSVRVCLCMYVLVCARAWKHQVREVLSSVVEDACEDKAVMAEAQRLRSFPLPLPLIFLQVLNFVRNHCQLDGDFYMPYSLLQS